ncbi:MAG: nucleotidyltransferase domain-containing protein [Chloroflexi bacterium]|nr:nucleotidyltransferase domain-containing protein [Chloroflexota bacterium]
MWDGYRARVYLFGSRARRMALEASDYDLVAVSPAFSGVSRFRRCLDRYELWHAAGGFRQSLDLHCYAPSEFRSELQGLGYLASARARGELVYVSHARSRRQAI